MNNEIQKTSAGISAVFPLVETTESYVEKKTEERKQCKFHFICRKAEDPEHAKQFVCQYLKPCKHGVECEKLKGEEAQKHKLYFTHDPLKKEIALPSTILPFCKHGSRCKKIDNTNHLTKYNHKLAVAESPYPKGKVQKGNKSSPKVKLPDADVQYVSAKFVLEGIAMDGECHKICTVFKKRLPKNLGSEEVKQKMTNSIIKRYVKGVTFSKFEFNVVCTIDSVGKGPTTVLHVAPVDNHTISGLPGLQTPTPLPVATDSLPLPH